MKQIFFLLSILFLLTACSSLPKVYPDKKTSRAKHHRMCRHLFPEGKWQFVHSIEATLPGGKKGLLLGVTRISSAGKTVQCVIMTIEGMVLFDARYDQQLVVNRSVPPFDSREFARGLLQDVRFIFFIPPGPLIESGSLENGAAVCRFQNPDKSFVDIIRYGEDHWEIRQYSRHYKKVRSVKAFFNQNEIDSDRFNVPKRLELTSHVHPGYTLRLDLIEAVPLTP